MTPTPGGPTLSALSLEGLTLTPAFDPAVTSYSAAVSSHGTTASMTATADEGLTINVYTLVPALSEEDRPETDEEIDALIAENAEYETQPEGGVYEVYSETTTMIVVSGEPTRGAATPRTVYWLDIVYDDGGGGDTPK